MVNSLKKLDKKFLIFAGCIIFIPLLIIIFLVIMQGCSNSRLTYANYEKKMITAFEKYITSKNIIPENEGEVVVADLNELVDAGYIKTTSKLLKDDSCTGSVTVRRNGASIDTNDGGFLNYTVSLSCDNYNTLTFKKKITSELVTTESGLYQVGSDYIFRGNKVNNYIKFFGHDYRIMSIDKDGIMKLIKAEIEPTSKFWDNKYNINLDKNAGKTIYGDSAILTYMIGDYKNPKKIMKKAKSHIVAYDSCIGKRSIDDKSINKDLDCSEKLEKQVVSLINVSDYAWASTDPDCDSIISKSCKNYNYLSPILFSSWTMNSVSENDYEVYFLSDGIISHQMANLYGEYALVIYIDGNELFTKGTGTITNPYVIG